MLTFELENNKNLYIKVLADNNEFEYVITVDSFYPEFFSLIREHFDDTDITHRNVSFCDGILTFYSYFPDGKNKITRSDQESQITISIKNKEDIMKIADLFPKISLGF